MNAEKDTFTLITADRLESWKAILNENNATPVVLVGVGHEDHLGELHVLAPENIPVEQIRKALFMALVHIDQKSQAKGGRP